MTLRLIFKDRGELSTAYGRVQCDPRVESCAVDVQDLSLSVRVTAGRLDPAAWERRLRDSARSR